MTLLLPDHNFYTVIHMKHFSVQRIKDGLKLDRRRYMNLYITIINEMEKHKFLKRTLNTIEAKILLKSIFFTVINLYPSIFASILYMWIHRCLTALTQNYNSNLKRRDPRKPNQSKLLLFISFENLVPRFFLRLKYKHQPFGTTALYLQRILESEIFALRFKDFLNAYKKKAENRCK